MIRHLFTLIWNRKKSNFLLISEVFFSFLVLFGVLSFMLYNYYNYAKPLGFAYDNVWHISLQSRSENKEQDLVLQEQMMQKLKSYPEIEHVAFSSSNAPFSFSSMNDNLSFGNSEKVFADVYEVDAAYQNVFQLKTEQGRWFNTQDEASLHKPIVINRKLRDDLFGQENPLDKVLKSNDSTQYKVVGVVPYFRGGSEFAAEDGAFFIYINQQKATQNLWGSVMLRVKPGTGLAFEEKMMKDLSAIAKGWTMDVATLEKMRQNKSKMTLVPMIALSMVCGFLILNVALGLFGVLWYNINRRYAEIGLRRALGATAKQIRNQFVGEVLVIATFGLLLGFLLSVQFPLLQVFQLPPAIYWQSIGAAALLIFLLVTVCAIYPSQQAAKIYPAVALHEE